MYNRPRVIPTLLIDNENLVKTKQFKKPRYLGDPINAIKIFNEKAVDELCVLDISASKNNSLPNMELLEKMASEAFMPLSYGGGIKSFDQIKEIFKLGYEKVILNSVFHTDPELIRQASEYFGSQSIVVSIDYKKTLFGSKCFIMDGTKKMSISPDELAKKAIEYGAGELLIYSIDNDGMRCGYDIDTIKSIASISPIPVIACGGADSLDDIYDVLSQGGASAVAAGSLFVYFGRREAVLINYPDETELIDRGIYKGV